MIENGRKECYNKKNEAPAALELEQIKADIATLNSEEIKLLLCHIRAMKGKRACSKRENN